MNFDEITPKQWLIIAAGGLGLLLLTRGGGGQQSQRTESAADREMRYSMAWGAHMTPQLWQDQRYNFDRSGETTSGLMDIVNRLLNPVLQPPTTPPSSGNPDTGSNPVTTPGACPTGYQRVTGLDGNSYCAAPWPGSVAARRTCPPGYTLMMRPGGSNVCAKSVGGGGGGGGLGALLGRSVGRRCPRGSVFNHRTGGCDPIPMPTSARVG